MISRQPFQTNEQKQELIAAESERRSYVCFYRELDECIDKCVSWHWHPALEIDYVLEGEIEYQTAEKSILVHTGEMIFVNSNVMHAVVAKDRQPGCKVYAHLFDPAFLGGSYDSILTEKYMIPVIKNRALDLFVLQKQDAAYAPVAENFLNAVELNRKEGFGYEFEIRTEISRMWLTLLKIFQGMPETSAGKNITDLERIKTMIAFIQKHYMEPLTLKKIAVAANISSRECTRCFNRNIRTSPVKYLNEYRVQMAAQMLLQTSETILMVSERCGFSSGGYFGKVFREIMGYTPKEFRTIHVESPDTGR